MTAPIVPAGYVLAPIEPTEAMMHAAEDVPAPRPFGAVYRAMVGAVSIPVQEPVAWGLLEIQDQELTNDPVLADYWTRKNRKVTPLYAAPAIPLPSAPVQGWVSVKDRLPDDYTRVMVIKDCGLDTLPSHAIAYLENSVWIADLGAGSLRGWGYQVTHWMPLPPPPGDGT